MSYFFATSGKIAGDNDCLNNYFDHVTNRAPKSTIAEKNLNITYYDEHKMLDDIYIRDEHMNSWLLLVGMPVLDRSAARATILHEFFRDPIATLNNEIDGHYCLFAFDASSAKIFVATDGNSFIPVFYKITKEGFIISSSELALANAVSAVVDPLGFAQSISLGVTWGEQTRFKEIRKLGAFELLSIDPSFDYSIKRYWSPEESNLWTGSNESIIERWIDIATCGLNNMVRQAGVTQISADVTGGEDSRMVLALCHHLGIPISTTRVRGFLDDSDVRIAKNISKHLGIPLDVEIFREIEPDYLEHRAVDIALETDGYGSIFASAIRHVTDKYVHGPRERQSLHLCGVPGGEVYRGAYYLRAKLLAPALMRRFDIPFFTRMKFLLDHLPDLYQTSNNDFLDVVNTHVCDALNEVDKYPAGIKIDHLLRTLQTCTFGLEIRRPFYLPLGLRDITKTIYSVSPKLKRGGRLTRACTELLYPEIAWLKTQKGVPTVKRTIGRSYLFIPEYIAKFKTIAAGVPRRLFHLNQDSPELNISHLSSYHTGTMNNILTEGETGKWFRSPEEMTTGDLYNPDQLSSLLSDAKKGQCRYVNTLGRIITAEFAMRFICDGSDGLLQKS